MKQLPEELLQLICENLCPWGYTSCREIDNTLLATLRSLSLANKALRRIAQPVMLQTLNFEKRRWSQVRSLLRLVSKQPHLARFVREITVPDWLSYEEEEDEKHSSLSATEAHVIQGLAKGLPASQELRHRLHADLVAGSKDAEFTMLLSLCSKLEYLHAKLPGPLDNYWIQHFLAQAAESAAANLGFAGFRCLRHVELNTSESGGLELITITPLLCLPALRKLSCWVLNCDEHEIPAIRSPIKSLQLRQALLEEEGLGKLLAVCPDVNDLQIEWGFSFISLLGDYDRWGGVLRKFGAKLVSLSIDISDCEEDEDLPIGTIGDLSSLSRLKTLTLPFDSLCDSELSVGDQLPLPDLLPPSLKTLYVWSSDTLNTRAKMKAYYDLQLTGLIHDTRFQALDKITLDRVPMLKIDLKGTDWKLSREESKWATLSRFKWNEN
ncbi:hypothetical protein M409DRAFT_19414 [Zasmidium cellare ATCC 36951]|uniref:F-box domain-containing protein n=1 Tax=Zasmidium cellare ATCC 36951 TaxID=1080233 RepID=A0A6A6CTL3_ZASCE|nr:uncharacterized protein M409DRAFT_19414 [Zasmidium cellare ATCC 36951]KAF2170597.1 hypothetical protein M409DRAFT_19414 [Zasmidium cellare ATCC 36951]